MYLDECNSDNYHQANTRATASDEGNLALDVEDIAELIVGVGHFDYNLKVLLLCRRDSEMKSGYLFVCL